MARSNSLSNLSSAEAALAAAALCLRLRRFSVAVPGAAVSSSSSFLFLRERSRDLRMLVSSFKSDSGKFSSIAWKPKRRIRRSMMCLTLDLKCELCSCDQTKRLAINDLSEGLTTSSGMMVAVILTKPRVDLTISRLLEVKKSSTVDASSCSMDIWISARNSKRALLSAVIVALIM